MDARAAAAFRSRRDDCVTSSNAINPCFFQPVVRSHTVGGIVGRCNARNHAGNVLVSTGARHPSNHAALEYGSSHRAVIGVFE